MYTARHRTAYSGLHTLCIIVLHSNFLLINPSSVVHDYVLKDRLVTWLLRCGMEYFLTSAFLTPSNDVCELTFSNSLSVLY